MRFATVLSLFATAALVAAQNAIGATETEPIYITSPIGTTDGHTGKHLIIEWNSHPSAPEMVDIELLQNSKVRETIGKVKSNSHRFNWAIPDNLDSSKMYAIRIGNSTYTSYSHPFAIKGAGAFPTNETNAFGNSVIATAVTNTAAQTVSGSVIEMASSAHPTSSHASTASASSTSAAASATASNSGGSSSKLTRASLVGAAAAGAAAVAFIL